MFLDEVIDEAEEIAKVGLLPEDATQTQIASAVSESVGSYIAPNSTAARLAEATFRRTLFLNHRVSVR